MLRKIGYSLLCIAASLSSNTYSMDNYLMPQGATVEYELPPNQPQLFINYMFWSVDAVCKITTPDDSNEFYIMALAKKGKINDIALSAGQSLSLTVHTEEDLKISAESGAKVEITNLGQHLVKATCTT